MSRIKKTLSILLVLVMMIGTLPVTTLHTHAWDIYVECEFCGEGAGDDWICSGGDHCGPTAAEIATMSIIVKSVMNAPTTRSSAKLVKCVWTVQKRRRSIASVAGSVV